MRRPWWKPVLLGLMVVVLGVGSYVGTSFLILMKGITQEAKQHQPPPGPSPTSPVTELPKPQKDERINVLALGLDDEQLRTDTMILFSIDPKKGQVAGLQIPRDTRARLAGKGTIEKINHAYAYGVGDPNYPGPYRAMRTVEELLGVPVHYYVRVDFLGFERIVDELGGVELTVPERMYYEDPYQDLVIDLWPGYQLLDGAKAIQFMRYRDDNGDLGRIERQQQFIKAFLDKVLSVGTLFKLPTLATQASDFVQTNLDTNQLLTFAKLATTMSRQDFTMSTLPGVDAYLTEETEEGQQPVSYFFVDPEQLEALLIQLGIGSEAT